MEHRQDIRRNHIPVVEDALVNDGLRRKAELPGGEGDQPKRPDDQGQQHPPRAPFIHYSTRSEAEEEACRADREQHGAQPVEPLEFAHDIARDLGLMQEQDHKNKTNGYHGQINVEYPPPGDILCETRTDERASDGADRPDTAQHTEPVAPEGKWDKVGDNDLGEGEDPAAANALNGAAGQDDAEVARERSDEGTGGE